MNNTLFFLILPLAIVAMFLILAVAVGIMFPILYWIVARVSDFTYRKLRIPDPWDLGGRR